MLSGWAGMKHTVFTLNSWPRTSRRLLLPLTSAPETPRLVLLPLECASESSGAGGVV